MKHSPKTLAIFHLVIMPGIFAIILMFSGNIIAIAQTFGAASLVNFDNVFFYSLMLVLAVNTKYLFRWKNTTTKEYFGINNYDYIITERDILEKIRKISLVIVLVLLTITIIHMYSEDNQNKKVPHILDLTTLILFSMLFPSFITFSNSYYIIHDQDSKKHFRLFLASGYFKRALKVEDDLKTKIIRIGLIWLNKHYKKKQHLHIENLEKINFKIIDENSKNENNTIEKITIALESGVENSALDIIAGLMEVKTLDLLVKDSIITIIKEWSTFIAAIISAIGGAVVIAKAFSS